HWLDASDRRHLVPHLCRRPRPQRRRHLPHALEVQRQILVGHDGARAPAIPRRLRGAGRPGRRDHPFGRTFRPERPRHRDDPPHAEGPDRGAVRGPRPHRGVLRSEGAAGRIRSGEFHSRGVTASAKPNKIARGKIMADVAPQAVTQTEAAAKPSPARYYVLALLTIVYALNFLDRTIFNVLIEPIKKEFALSDTMMGLLAGFGFVLFYSICGIPIARI